MLRPATAADAELISAWLCDPAVNGWLTSNLRGQGLSPQLVQVALRRRDMAWWVFGAAEDGPPAGLVALDGIDPVDGVANLWFLLGDHAQARSGLTSGAIRRFCEIDPAGLRVAMAWAIETNEASRRTLARAGFAERGYVPDAVALPGGGRCGRVIVSRAFGGG